VPLRECKKYKLRSARKPIDRYDLSGVVVVGEGHGLGYTYVSFSLDFVEAVGKALPEGLSSMLPAYIKVVRMPGRDTWRVYAKYLHEERGVVLWDTHEKPSWIGKVFYH
jgi:hypothetical protein